jgi:hypothetical protein
MKPRIIWRNPSIIYTFVNINFSSMKNYNFNSSDILYQTPRDIMKYLTRSDFALIIALEPHTLETMEVLEILLWNFEVEEIYEWCAILKKEIDLRVKTYGKEEEEEEEPGEDLSIQG